jgi:hypothetical protein
MALKGHIFRIGALAPEETPFRWWEKGEVPQRLKPLFSDHGDGAAKAAPFQSGSMRPLNSADVLRSHGTAEAVRLQTNPTDHIDPITRVRLRMRAHEEADA